MPIDTRLQRALSLAKAGKLEEAQNILLTLDSPEAEKLLDKVNKALAARGTSKPPAPTQEVAPPKAKNIDLAAAVAEGVKQADKAKQAEKSKNMGYGCLGLLVICGICFVIYAATSQPSIDKTRADICVDALRGMPMGTTCILDRFPDELEVCYERLGDVNIDADINQWYDCLLEQGVGSNMLDFAN